MPAGRRASVLVDDAADGAAAGLVATAVLVLAVVAEIEVALWVGAGLALLLVAVLHAVVVGRALRLVERVVLALLHLGEGLALALLGVALAHAVQAGIAGRRNVGVTDARAATAEQQGKTEEGEQKVFPERHCRYR